MQMRLQIEADQVSAAHVRDDELEFGLRAQGDALVSLDRHWLAEERADAQEEELRAHV